MQMGKSQADKRRDMNLVDQFGRKWLAAIDRETFDPTGHVTPAGWSDPLSTPSQYVGVPRDEHQNPQMGQAFVDFPRWIADQVQATKDWKVRLWNIGRDLQKNAFNAKTAETDEYLLHLTGPKPWPASEVLEQAAAGDKRLLGLKDLDKATRLLLGRIELEDLESVEEPEGEPEPSESGPPPLNIGSNKEFVASALRRGFTMKQAQHMYKELRASLNLQEA
jgi:hypothetical protein